jgi:excisionase family DNA binding protein
MAERLLKVSEVAASLSCSQSKVKTLIHTGKLDAISFGHRSLRVHPQSLQQFINNSKIR